MQMGWKVKIMRCKTKWIEEYYLNQQESKNMFEYRNGIILLIWTA